MNRLGIFHRRTLYWVCAILFVTGACWALLHYLPEQFGLDERGATSSAALLMKVHGAAAMLALVLIGTLLPGHINRGLENGLNLRSGMGMLFLLGVLTLTGYFLYYAGSEELRKVNSFIHLAAGTGLPGLVLAHMLHRLRAPARGVSAEFCK